MTIVRSSALKAAARARRFAVAPLRDKTAAIQWRLNRFLERLNRELAWYRARLPSALLRPILLPLSVPRSTKRLVVFLTPGFQMRSGGVLSIGTLYRESLPLQHLHRSTVVLCTLPGDPPLVKYTWFKNNNYMLDLRAVVERCDILDSVMVHIPEYAVNRVAGWLDTDGRALLSRAGELHFNVMLQNIDLIAGQDVRGLQRFGKVTCTAGHEAYTNLATRESLGVPVHRLTVIVRLEEFLRSDYEAKQPLLIVSPDSHPLKDAVLRNISQALPGLKICVIRKMSFEEYKRLIHRAKWALTFGEGLDGYFAEPIFCGGVSFAVFNNRFFTPEFAALETVYPSWEVLMERIVGDLQRLDEPQKYRDCSREAYEVLASRYQIEPSLENLRQFYRGEYTFP